MILKHSYLRAPADSTQSSPPAANVAVPRQPSAEELATEFVADPAFLDASDPSGIQQKKEPPEKSIEKKEAEVKVDPEAKKVEAASEVKPIVPLASKEEKKVEAKVESVKTETTKPAAGEIKPILPLAAQPKQRDYTGFTPEEQSVLKAMSNEAFEYTSKLIREQKELSKLKDSHYLQDPRAYTLSPDYQKLQEDAYYLNAEAQYWQNQLVEIDEGREWAPIVGWTKNGSPALGPKQKPTSVDAERIRVAMGQCFSKAQQINEQVQQFGSRYKQQIDLDNQVIQQECARRFGWVADPKLLDEKVSNPSIGEKTIKQVREDFINLFPPYHQNSVGVQVGAHLFAALQIYGQKIHELENMKQVEAVKEEEKSLIEPTSKAAPVSSGKSSNGKMPAGVWAQEFSLEGMPV